MNILNFTVTYQTRILKNFFYNFILYQFQPIPIDSINKYWGVDAVFLKHDDTLQKQSYDQSNKNFWSFVENNIENNPGITMTSSQQQSFSNSNNSGFSQTNFSQSNANSNKITGLSYQEARTRAGMK